MIWRELPSLVVQLVWLATCCRHMWRVGRFKPSCRRDLGVAALCTAVLAGTWAGPALWDWALTGRLDGSLFVLRGPWSALAWAVVAVVLLLADAFFDEEPVKVQWPFVVAPPLVCALAALTEVGELATGLLLWVVYLLFCVSRGKAERRTLGLLAAAYALLTALLLCALLSSLAGMWLVVPLAGAVMGTMYLVHALVQGGLVSLQHGFESASEAFQADVLAQQYAEIRDIYLNMRGWRHDYHNHLQVMKAQLAAGQTVELAAYLDDLEADLDRVDTYVKSGNLMVDAILNSKLSLAEAREVAVNCSAQVPEDLAVDDVDLCVILGNLLDNALESCEKLGHAPGERWLRVYLAVRAGQLYASIQNAALEELGFNERNYITGKRGEHGFGMRRVAAVVEKYGGTLRLANEPGVFAAEVSLPV